MPLNLKGRTYQINHLFFSSDQRGTGLIDKITNDHRSLVQLSLEVSDKGSGKLKMST